jgi:hypothetical protein
MNDPKPLASLGPALLARKGGAKPAMRPQAPGFAPKESAQCLEDLGWNDMGEDDTGPDHSAQVLQLTPAPHNPEAEAKTDKGSPKPKVRTMHEELEARLAEAGTDAADKPAIPLKKKEALASKAPVIRAVPDPAPLAEAPAQGKSEAFGRRAAFTLRLDAKRHLKLRLASTVRNRSAQQLVTEALDRFLNDIPEVEALAAQVQRD